MAPAKDQTGHNANHRRKDKIIPPKRQTEQNRRQNPNHYLEKKQSVKHWSGNSIVYGFDADGLLTTPSAFFFGILLRITKTGTDKIGD